MKMKTTVSMRSKKKKKKNKRKNKYSAIDETNCIESNIPYISSSSSCLSLTEKERSEHKTNSKKSKKKIFIQEEKKLRSLLHENKIDIKDTFDKIIKKKKKKQLPFHLESSSSSSSSQENSNYNENRNAEYSERSTTYFINKINKILKKDSESISIENEHTKKVELKTKKDTQYVENNIIDIRMSTKENTDVKKIEKSDNITVENESDENENRNEPIGENENIFNRFFLRIKNKLIERKGNPITNENVEEHVVNQNESENEICELQIISNTLHEDINNMNRKKDELNEVYRNNESLQKSPTSTVAINGQNRTQFTDKEEIISLNELNPNDVFDNQLMENRTTENIDSNQNNAHDSNDSPQESRFRSIYPTTILMKAKMRLTNIKEKIKKYWADRVEEANTQIHTPHHNTRANAANRENGNTTEDENDDPSCLQVLFFFGLICKFPILWIIGSVIFCITPDEQKKRKRWSLINSIFAFLSILYFIVTSKIKTGTAGFTVLMNEKIEPHFLFHKGLIKHNHVVRSFILLDKSNELNWICWYEDNGTLCKTGNNQFLDWNFVQKQKPTRNILLTKDIYKLLNRIQVTVIFGKGSSYETEETLKINRHLKNAKTDMDPIPYESVSMTDKEIPTNFYGCGLRCVRADSKETEKWFLFWKEGNKSNFFNVPVPVGDIFFFKNEYDCKIGFIFPQTVNVNREQFPENFVEVERILIKSF